MDNLMDEAKFQEIVENVIQQYKTAGIKSTSIPVDMPESTRLSARKNNVTQNDPAADDTNSPAFTVPRIIQPIHSTKAQTTASLQVDLPDPTLDEYRYRPLVNHPKDPAALRELIASTSARIGVGRTGPRYKTASQLLFQGDHAITQDALYREIDQRLLDEFKLFTIQTKVVEGKEQYLLRPDLGRQINDEGKRVISQKCSKAPNIQIVVGDGLSTTAIEANLRQIMPVLLQGFQNANLSVGTPFYVKYCRVGVMNDIGETINPDIVILLIGERPGLGRAESMSAYMGYKPKHGNNDADRDVICNIFENGGTNPLEAGAFIVQFAKKMVQHQASGVKLKLVTK
jgi:ethanolamine ammonia-lyase small subunit